MPLVRLGGTEFTVTKPEKTMTEPGYWSGTRNSPKAVRMEWRNIDAGFPVSKSELRRESLIQWAN
jgi:hypothetical protein